MPHYSLARRRFTAADDGPATLGSWEPLGPINVGGRTKALVIDPTHPDTMYAGTATGGVWKTTDAGQNWQPLTDSLPTLAVNSLVMDPSDPNTLYAGTGEVIPGAGVFKTADGGQTWTQLPPTAGFAYVYSMAISSSRPKDVYAATDSGLWASLDGGTTWRKSLSMPGGCLSTAVRGDQPSDIVFASCSNQSGGNPYGYPPEEGGTSSGDLLTHSIYRNLNGATDTWQTVFSATNMGPTVLAIAPSAPNSVYALATNNNPNSPFFLALLGLYASDQGGAVNTWQLRANTTSNPNGIAANILSYPDSPPACSYSTNQGHRGQGDWNLVLAVDPTDSQTLFVAGPRIARSMDGGRTFAGVNTTPNALFHTDYHAFAFHPGYNGADNQTLFNANDGGVYRSDVARTQSGTVSCGDQYYTLSGGAINNGLQVTQFYHGAVSPSGVAYLGGTQDTVTLMGFGPGQTAWNTLFNGDGGGVAYDPGNSSTFYFESTAATWPPLVKTSNGGVSFQAANAGIIEPTYNFSFLSAFTLDPNDSQTLYFGGHQLWRSRDGGASWTSVSPDTGASITWVTVNPANSSQVVLGTYNGWIFNSGTGSLFATLPRLGYVSDIVFDPSQSGVVYATYATFRANASDAQLYVSSNGGATWNALGASSLPDIPVHALLVDPDTPATLYVGTDAGIFVSFDSGSTWAHDSSFPNVIVESLVMDKRTGAKYVYAFTHGRGAWRVNLTPSANPCSYSVSPSSFSLSGDGTGLFQVNVNTQAGCQWSASNISPYLYLQNPVSGAGPGSVFFAAAANFNGADRLLQIDVQGQLVPVDVASIPNPNANNDELSSALVIGSLPYFRAQTFTLTSNPSDPVHSCTGSADLSTSWYLYTAQENTTIEALAILPVNPTVIAVYQTTNGALGPELACSASTSGAAPLVKFSAGAGVTYAIEVGDVTNQAPTYFPLFVFVPPTVSITPADAPVAPGGTLQFSAAVGGAANQSVTWSAAAGSIDATGKFTAPSANGPVTITATSVADPTVQTSVTVIVQNLPAPVYSAASVVNAASQQGGPIAPGEMITVYGSGMGPSKLAGALLTAQGAVAANVGGTQATINGFPAPILYTSDGQVSVVVPFEVGGTGASMVVSYGGQPGPAVALSLTNSAPALFTADSSGAGQAAARNSDNSANSAQSPAERGSVVTLFGTGMGQTNPASGDGVLAASPYPSPILPVAVQIGGETADILYAGAAPGAVDGVLQVNVQIPADLTAGSVPVVLKIGEHVSRTGVTLNIK